MCGATRECPLGAAARRNSSMRVATALTDRFDRALRIFHKAETGRFRADFIVVNQSGDVVSKWRLDVIGEDNNTSIPALILYATFNLASLCRIADLEPFDHRVR